MIRKLTGIVDEVFDESLVLDVRGVGYFINVFNACYDLGQEISLFIELYIKDTEIKLYGFRTVNELKFLFELLKVRGISHKIAGNMITALGLEALQHSILHNEPTKLKGTGVGPKLFSRVVAELQDSNLAFANQNSKENDLVSALANLGYPLSNVRDIVKKIYKENSDKDFSQLLKTALQYLS